MFQFLCGARTVTCRTVFGGAIFAQVSKSPYQGVCSVYVGHALLLVGQCSAGQCLSKILKSPYQGVCSICVGHGLLLVGQRSAGQCLPQVRKSPYKGVDQSVLGTHCYL